jgi:hypothetical protein
MQWFVASRASACGGRLLARSPHLGYGSRRMKRGPAHPARCAFTRWVTTLLAFGVLLLAPAWARAAIVPTCGEEPGATRIPEPMCEVIVTFDEETGTTQAAPLCDLRAASMIAPPRFMPISDASLRASEGCGPYLEELQLGERTGDPYAGGIQGLAGLVTLDASSMPRPLYELTEIDFVVAVGAPRQGERGDVYRPPRG